MYKNKAHNGKNNISGINIKQFRQCLEPRTSQRALADKMQLEGIELDKNAIQRIESGQRFVTDIELKAFAKVLKVSYIDLLKEQNDF
jgi:Helix-turn-helix.